MQNLEKNLLKTLAFFDIFDYPLTLMEIYKYLPYEPIIEIKQALGESDKIQSKLGFYFLAGHCLRLVFLGL